MLKEIFSLLHRKVLVQRIDSRYLHCGKQKQKTQRSKINLFQRVTKRFSSIGEANQLRASVDHTRDEYVNKYIVLPFFIIVLFPINVSATSLLSSTPASISSDYGFRELSLKHYRSSSNLDQLRLEFTDAILVFIIYYGRRRKTESFPCVSIKRQNLVDLNFVRSARPSCDRSIPLKIE